MSTKVTLKVRRSIPEQLYTNNKIIFGESIIAIILLWTIVSRGFNLTNEISTPIMVGDAFITMILSFSWIDDYVATFRRVIFGFILTALIGTPLGIAMGMSDFYEFAFQDYVTIGLALPSLFVAVFAAMMFGISDITPMVASATISFPFLTQNVYEGVINIDNRLLKMSSSFDVSRLRVIRRILLMGVLPQWFAGARYALAITWKITTLAELVAAQTGIGYMIYYEMSRLSFMGVLSWTLLFTLTILVFEYGIFQQIEKRLLDWKEEAELGMTGAV